MPQIKINQENDYDIFKLFPFKRRDDNFGFNTSICIKIVGIEFFNSFFVDPQWVIYDSAKDTRKTYSVVVMCIWAMCNFEHINILWLRNTIALLKRSSLETFKKVMNRLVRQEKLTRLKEEVKAPLGGNAEKQYVWPTGEVIAFRAFEKAEELSGIDCEEGFFAYIVLEEPMERTTGKIIDFEEQRRSFAMIVDSVFRGIPSPYYGKFKYKWEDTMYEFSITIGVRAMFNDWEPNHWINTDIVSLTFPWNSIVEGGITYEEWILKDPFINNWYEMQNLNLVVEGISKLQGALVVRNTKFSNPYRQRDRDNIILADLFKGDPMARTATIGAPYEGTDPLRYPYRDAVIVSMDIGCVDVFKIKEWHKFSFGLDFGKVDKTSLTLVGVYWDNELDAWQMVAPISITFNPKLVSRSQRHLIRRIDIADMVKEWTLKILEFFAPIGILDVPCLFTYDEKGEQTAEELQVLLQSRNIGMFDFSISIKKGWLIENRQKVIVILLSSGALQVNWEACEDLRQELWDMEYKEDEMIRDEKHFHVDTINSLEYAIEPLKDMYVDFNLLNMLYLDRATGHAVD